MDKLDSIRSFSASSRPAASLEAAIDAAIAGVGITRILSYQMQAAMNAKQFKIILQEFEPAPIPVNSVFSHQRRLPLKLRAFLDFAAPRLRERL